MDDRSLVPVDPNRIVDVVADVLTSGYWGPFRITALKRENPRSGLFGAFECVCPFVIVRRHLASPLFWKLIASVIVLLECA